MTMPIFLLKIVITRVSILIVNDIYYHYQR